MSAYTKARATAFQEIQMNAGIVCDDFTPATGAHGNIIGVTTGGLTFNSNPEYTDYGEDMDNVPPNTWQLKRIKSYDPALSGNWVTLTAEEARKLVGAGILDSAHIIPGTELTESDFDDIWLVGDYSDKNNVLGHAGYIAIHIMHALNTGGFQWTSQKDGKGQFAFDYHGHYDLNNIDQVPFEIYVKAGDSPTLEALTVASVAGTEVGDSKITVTGYTLGTGEMFRYKTAASTAPTVTYGDIVGDGWTTFTSGDDITPTSGDTKIAVVAADSNYRAIGYGSATITKKTS